MSKNQETDPALGDRAFQLRSKQANCVSSFIFNQKNKKRVAIARSIGNAIETKYESSFSF